MLESLSSIRTLLAFAALAALMGCSHPLEITGEGDINAIGDGSSCALEDAPCPNKIIDNYNVTYTAVPRAGFGFLGWDGCLAAVGNQCTFSIPASAVHAFWNQTVPPLRANFSPHVPLGNLSGDFASSVDCEGHIVTGGEAVARFRESTAVAGENQKQCIGNGIFFVPSLNENFLVWLDILHIDAGGQPIFDLVNGEVPIREIIGNFGDDFIVGKTYTLAGFTLPAGGPISIEIIWLDLDASFGGFTGCYVTESQAPIGAPTRKKTYCPLGDGTWEIKENIPVVP